MGLFLVRISIGCMAQEPNRAKPYGILALTSELSQAASKCSGDRHVTRASFLAMTHALGGTGGLDEAGQAR